MADQKTDQALNKVFSKSQQKYIPVIGKENYIKVALETAIAFCYIDCYQFKGIVQHELITIVRQNDGSSQVFKNNLELSHQTQFTIRDLNEIKVSISPNPCSDRIALLRADYIYKTTKKTKLAILTIDFNEIKKGGKLIIQEISLAKTPLQARWHLYEGNFIIILTEQCFEILQYLSQDFQHRSMTSLRNLSFQQKIVDFCFWPIDHQLKYFKLLAIGDEGTLFVLLLRIGNMATASMTDRENQILSSTKEYEFKLYQILERSSDASYTSIFAYSFSMGVTVLVKKAMKNDQRGRSSGLVISAVVQMQGKYVEKLIAEIMSEPNQQIQFPSQNLLGCQFYFWEGGRLLRTDLSAHMDYVRSLVSDQVLGKPPKCKLVIEILLQVNLQTIKFVAVDRTSIKMLRRAETFQQYLFSTIELQASSLLFEEKTATAKLQQVFKDLSNKISDIKAQMLMESIVDVSNSWKELKEEGSPAEIEQKYHNADIFVENMKDLLESGQKQLKDLYQQAKQCSKEFERSKHRWSELKDLVSRIQANAQNIDRMQEEIRMQNDETQSLDSIKNRCVYVNTHRIDIDESLREEYMGNFEYQYQCLRQLERVLEGNETKIRQMTDI